MPGITHAGCFAHVRRKFFEAMKSSDKPQSAEEGIKHIRKLYNIEDELCSKKMDNEKFLIERKAINNNLFQWDKMTAYLESPY